MTEERLTMTVLEAARCLGISKGLAYQMAHENRLPIIKFGKRMLVSRYGLEQMLKEAKPNSRQDAHDNR